MIFLIFAILTTCLGQIFYKLYFKERRKFLLLITVFFFTITPLFSFQALKTLSIDIVYLSTALNIVLILLFSILFLKEQVSKRKIFASFLIVIGVLIFNLV